MHENSQDTSRGIENRAERLSTGAKLVELKLLVESASKGGTLSWIFPVARTVVEFPRFNLSSRKRGVIKRRNLALVLGRALNQALLTISRCITGS